MLITRRFLASLLCLLLLAAVLIFGHLTATAGYLYLLNDDESGNRIYAFSVNETNGALTPLTGFPVSAMLGGDNHIVSERMIVDQANARLYVINEVSDTISAFSIDRGTGAITPLPFSPITLPTGGYDTIAVHPSGSPLLAANISSTTPFVASFVITATTARRPYRSLNPPAMRTAPSDNAIAMVLISNPVFAETPATCFSHVAE